MKDQSPSTRSYAALLKSIKESIQTAQVRAAVPPHAPPSAHPLSYGRMGNSTQNTRTPAQQEASRRNGALSRGSITP